MEVKFDFHYFSFYQPHFQSKNQLVIWGYMALLFYELNIISTGHTEEISTLSLQNDCQVRNFVIILITSVVNMSSFKKKLNLNS